MRAFPMFIAASGLLLSNIASAGGMIQYEEGRLKIQVRDITKDSSIGSYQLRSILEQHGFKNEGGYVATKDALKPLEIYNYLYEDGNYVFTIFLPTDSKFTASFHEGGGFVSFSGIAAQKLFDVVKLYLPKNNNREEYVWYGGPSGTRSSCSKSEDVKLGEYRCWLFW